MKIIDLFSGIGGFALGFQRAGYEFTEHYFSEIDKSAIANYKKNFPNAKYIGDITTIQPADIAGADIITFGSPCIDFSIAGKRGKSGGLHSDMTVIQLNPSTESNGRQPYQQNRVYDERGISPALTRNNNDFIIKQRPRGKNKGADLSICPTISSNAFQENNLLCGIRRLTEIECERLQGFPDNWTQYGNYNGRIRRISKTKRYKLIGNAVTVDIVELIAKRLNF
jgi:cytosine-specific methyltransferase